MSETRREGAKAQTKATAKVRRTEKSATRQSNGKANSAELFGGLMCAITNGAAHQAKILPAAEAATAIQALSNSSNWTSLNRPAPIEIRKAISRWRDAAWAVIRFATFAQAIRSTIAIRNPSTISERRYSVCIPDRPLEAGSSSSF